jgi:hypothetical protein
MITPTATSTATPSTIWTELSKSPMAVPLLRQYPEHIDWTAMCRWNKSPEILEILARNPTMIDYDAIQLNPSAEIQKNVIWIDWLIEAEQLRQLPPIALDYMWVDETLEDMYNYCDEEWTEEWVDKLVDID